MLCLLCLHLLIFLLVLFFLQLFPRGFFGGRKIRSGGSREQERGRKRGGLGSAKIKGTFSKHTGGQDKQKLPCEKSCSLRLDNGRGIHHPILIPATKRDSSARI